jgi:hypothetical protein
LTLERVLAARVDEWAQTVGSGGGWSASVLFVAHEIPSSEPLAEVRLPEVIAEIRAVTFKEFITGVDPKAPDTIVAFRELVHKPLAEDRTPDSIREKLVSLIS